MPRRSRTSTSNSRAADPLAASRLRIWQVTRETLSGWITAWPLPNINPDVISLASLVLALLFVMAYAEGFVFVAWLYLLVHLFLDAVDGAIARRYGYRRTKTARRHGQVVDILADRASEGILFLWPVFFLPWFPLFLLNVLLSIIAVKKQVAVILPLRQAFFIVFTIMALW